MQNKGVDRSEGVGSATVLDMFHGTYHLTTAQPDLILLQPEHLWNCIGEYEVITAVDILRH